MPRIIIHEFFTVGLVLFIVLVVVEVLEPGFATNFINMPAFATLLIIAGFVRCKV